MNNTKVFSNMHNLFTCHEEYSEKLNNLKENNQLEYHKYSLSIMNFVKAKSIIDNLYNQMLKSRIDKTLTENELIDDCLKSLETSKKFLTYSKEKISDVFEILSKEYSNKDEIRYRCYEAIECLNSFSSLDADLNKQNDDESLIYKAANNLLKRKFEKSDKELNDISNRLTFSCDLLELLIGANASIEKCLEELSKEFILELADL